MKQTVMFANGQILKTLFTQLFFEQHHLLMFVLKLFDQNFC